MRQPGARAGAKVTKKQDCGVNTPTPSPCQSQTAARPSAAEIRNELLARAALSPDAVPGAIWGVSWLFFRDRATRLLAVRAISAEELAVAPFPECRGRA